MPAPAQWIFRLPRIIEALATMPAPVVDRATMQALFGVRRRRAHELMAHFSSGGGYTAGKALLLDRLDLLAKLRGLELNPDVQWERQRRAKLSAAVDKLRRESVSSAKLSVIMPREVVNTTLDRLPKGVRLEPGLVTVEFSTPEELLERLFSLAQALNNDYESFEHALRRAKSHGLGRAAGRAES